MVPPGDNDDDDEDHNHPHDEIVSSTMSVVTTDSNRTYGQKDPSLVTSKRSARRAPSTEPDRKSSHLREEFRQNWSPPREGEDNSDAGLMLGLPREVLNRDRGMMLGGRNIYRDREMILGGGSILSDRHASHAFDRAVSRHPQKLRPPLPRPPPGFNNIPTGSHTLASTRYSSNSSNSNNSTTTLGYRAQSSTVSGRFDDATEDVSHRNFEHAPENVSQRSNRNLDYLPVEPERHLPRNTGRPYESEEFDIEHFFMNMSFPDTHISSLTPEERLMYAATATVTSNLSVSDVGSARGGSRNSGSGDSRSGNPRSILNERYQKKHKHPLSKKDFVTVRDTSDGDHVPTFTSVFVCPDSGECFLSGDYLPSDFVAKRDGMNWYRKKSTAEFAAAGRAEDCHRFRSGECGSDGQQFCAELPYLVRSREEHQEEISVFLSLRTCDAITRDRVKQLSKGRLT